MLVFKWQNEERLILATTTVFQSNLEYLPERIKVLNFPNITRRFATRDRDVIMFTGRNFCNFLVNFEISLTLFNINTPRNFSSTDIKSGILVGAFCTIKLCTKRW